MGGVAAVLQLVLNLAMALVILSAIVSWVGADMNNPLVQMIRQMTEPMYRPFRKLTGNLPGPIDWAPLIVMLIIVFLSRGVVPMIASMGRNTM